MNRNIPFDANAKCESCGVLGAYDFMGDELCHKCAFPDENQQILDKYKLRAEIVAGRGQSGD